MMRLRTSFVTALKRGTRLRFDGRTKRRCVHLLGRETMLWTHVLQPGVSLTNNLAH